jgi:hypothetical protein
VFVELAPELAKQVTKKSQLTNIRMVGPTTMQILRSGARAGTFVLPPRAVYVVRLRFVPTHRKPIGCRVLALDLRQEIKGRVIGGNRFVLKTAAESAFLAPDATATHFDGVSWRAAKSAKCGCGCGG